MVGGTNIKKDYRELGLQGGGPAPDILVATPGRLNDHLENSPGVARTRDAARGFPRRASRRDERRAEALANAVSR